MPDSKDNIKDSQIARLKKLLWLNHGHIQQYGDDGEMQCFQCIDSFGFWDWKNTPIDTIIKKLENNPF